MDKLKIEIYWDRFGEWCWRVFDKKTDETLASGTNCASAEHAARVAMHDWDKLL